jgi:hypothetical protein
MKVLEITNIQRQPLGRITWQSPNQFNLEVLQPECEANLKAFINRAQNQGFPRRTGREVQEGDHNIIIDEQIMVKPGDEHFLETMADAVSRYTFGGQRAFGLVKQQEVES